jgi:DUF1680 family protein
VMWNWRMLALTGEARFADLLETTLYNGVLAGLSLDGQSYFYQNPLADTGKHRRQPWFGCACCPPNVARLLASLPGYFYSTSDEGVWAHLYAAGRASITLPDGERVTLEQHTRYPWEGEVRIEVATAASSPFSLFLRIPGWCESATASVNGRPVDAAVRPSSYLELRREWREGDVIELTVSMPARRVECHPYVANNHGCVALARGPLIYCIEGVDHPEVDLRDLRLPADARLQATFEPATLGGMTVITAAAWSGAPGGGDGRLYRPVSGAVGPASDPVQPRRFPLRAIPYYAWANREPGSMAVWIRTDSAGTR